jgi:hypothetical protein
VCKHDPKARDDRAREQDVMPADEAAIDQFLYLIGSAGPTREGQERAQPAGKRNRGISEHVISLVPSRFPGDAPGVRRMH